MLTNVYKQPLWNVIFLLVFLCTGCNQKQSQNADSTGETDDHSDVDTKGKAPFIVSILKDKPTPAIVSGTGAIYLKAVKASDPHLNVWHFTSNLEGASEKDSYHQFINTNRGVKFEEEPETNQFGLYFGDYQTKTKVSVCGTSECSSQFMNLEMLVIQTNPEQFQKLLDQASALAPKTPTAIEWDLYFLDSKLQTFQNEEPLKLSIDPSNTESAFHVEWKGFLNNNDTTSTNSFDVKPMILKWIKLKNREFLVGTYESDGTTYSIFGIKLLQLQKN